MLHKHKQLNCKKQLNKIWDEDKIDTLVIRPFSVGVSGPVVMSPPLAVPVARTSCPAATGPRGVG